MISVHHATRGAGTRIVYKLLCAVCLVSVLSVNYSLGQVCSFDIYTIDLDIDARQNDLNYRSVTKSSWKIGDLNVRLENKDIQKAGSHINHTLGMGLLGGELHPYIMSLSSDKTKSIDVLLKLSEPVEEVAFLLLDIDRDTDWDWQDSIQIIAYSKNVILNPSHYQFTYDPNNVFRSPGTTSFIGLRNQVDNVGALGNLSVRISGVVDSVRIRYAYTNDLRIRTGAEQHVGLTQIKLGSQKLCETPILKNDIVCTEKGSVSEIYVLSNDFIKLPDTSTLQIIRSPHNGIAYVDFAKGAILYTPGNKFFFTDSLSYLICDQNGNCGDTTVVSFFHDHLQSFFVNSDINITRKGQIAIGNVLTNDFDYRNEPLTMRTNFLIPPLHGSVDLKNDGSYIYTPQVGFVGSDHFSVLVCRKSQSTNCKKTRVDVLVVDHCLECKDQIQGVTDHFSYPMGSNVQGNVLDNDVFNRALHQQLKIEIIEPPIFGTVELEANGDYHYIPRQSEVKEDVFSYALCTERQSDCVVSCDTVDVLLTPLYLNNQCQDFVCNLQDVVLTGCINDITRTSLKDKVSMYSNQTILFTETAFVTDAQGRVSIKSDGEVYYSPNQDFEGNDQFTYEVCFKTYEDQHMYGKERTDSGQREIWSFSNTHEDDLLIGVEGLIKSIELTSIDLSGIDQSQVELTLVSPSKTEVVVYLGQCGSGLIENFSFSDNGIGRNNCPFISGAYYVPVEPLSSFVGEDLKGIWKLRARPLGPVPTPNTVFLADWTLEFQIRPLSTVGCQKATVYLDISENLESVLMPDSAVAIQGDCIDLDVLLNDSDDIGFDTTSSYISSYPKNGTAIWVDGQLRYCPDAFFIGRDTMEYAVQDYGCLCGKGTVRSSKVVIDVYAPLSVNYLDAHLEKDFENNRHITWNVFGNGEPDEFRILRISNSIIDTFCVTGSQVSTYSDYELVEGDLFYVVEALKRSEVIARSKKLTATVSLSAPTIYYNSDLDKIIWSLNETHQTNAIRIIDQVGRVVHSSDSNSGSIVASNWPAGFYIFSYQRNGRPQYKKLIVY